MEICNNKISLLRFFVFNSGFSVKEGEEEKKILYYWSRDSESIDTRCKYVGLAEAAMRFGAVFSKTKVARCLATQKSRTVFLNPEEEFYMVMTVSVPCKLVRKPDKKNDCIELRPEDVNDDVYLAILEKAYLMFRFFTGNMSDKPETFIEEVIEKTRDVTRKKVSHFFSRYVPTIKIDNSDIFDILPSLRFLSLEPSSFLKVQTLVNRIENQFPDKIHSVTFLHQGSLVWSGLQQEEACLLFHYLNTSLLPRQQKENEENDESPSKDVRNPFQSHRGRFFVGPRNLKDEVVPRVPSVKIDSSEYHLVAYGALLSTVVLTVNTSENEDSLSLDFYRQLDSFLGPTLTTLSVDLMDVFKKVEESPISLDNLEDPGTRFIYYNASNRALKSTVVVSSSAPSKPHIIRVIGDVYSDIRRILPVVDSNNSNTLMELSVRSVNDQWVVARKSGERQVFITVTNKNSNLIEVSSEIDRLMSEEFKKVCLLEK